jgi:hypothetical protein
MAEANGFIRRIQFLASKFLLRASNLKQSVKERYSYS